MKLRMDLTALISTVIILATPCNIPHPQDLTCREYAMHLAAEKAYLAQDTGDECGPDDFSDSCVGCVDDCLEPVETTAFDGPEHANADGYYWRKANAGEVDSTGHVVGGNK